MTAHSRFYSASRRGRGPLLGPVLALTAALVLWTGGGSVRAEDLSEDEKIFYYMGVAMEQSLRTFTLSDEELDLVIRGLREAHAGKQIELDSATYHPKSEALGRQRWEKAAQAEKLQAHAFLAEAAQRKGAIRTKSGLIYTEIIPGSGDSPQSTDTVEVRFSGSLRDGTVFVSSDKSGNPFELKLDRVIPCWQEGISMMKVGGKSVIICPPEIAYGEWGKPPKVPGNAAVSFEFELVGIK